MQTQRPKVRISFRPAEDEVRDAARLASHERGHTRMRLAPGGKKLFAALALFVLAIGSSIPAANGEWLMNDDVTVSSNAALRSWRGIVPIWTTAQRLPQIQPFTFSALLVEYQVFHNSRFVYHVVNLVLHACCVLMLWALLRKLELRGAWLMAALFAVHPVTVASVAWISQQKVLWATLWFLAALIVYFRYCGLNPQPDDDPEMAAYYQLRLPRTRWLLYAIAMVLLGLSLCSQAALAVTFVPVVLILIWWDRSRITRGDVVPLILPVFLSAAFAIATVIVEVAHNNSRGADFPTLIQRPLLVGRAIWFNVMMTIAPVRPAFAYQRWNLSAANLWPWLPLLCLIAVLIALWKLRPLIGRGPLAAAFLYIALLLPLSGMVNFGWMRQSYVGDHLQYLACAVPIVAIVAALAEALPVRRNSIVARATAATAGVVIAVLLLIGSLARARDYNDQHTLWTRTLEVNPRSVAAHNSLGQLALGKDDRTTAERHFRKALDIDSENIQAYRNLAEVYRQPGQWDRAIGQYYQILRRAPSDVDAYFMLAVTLADQGDSTGAVSAYQKVIELQPNNSKAYLNLAQLYEKRRDLQRAVDCYQQSIKLDPRQMGTRNNLALLLFQYGFFEAAMEQLNAAKEIDPRSFETYFNGTMILDEWGKVQPADKKYAVFAIAEQWSFAACNIRNDSAIAFLNRGKILARLSKFESKPRALELLSESVSCFRRAQSLQPGLRNAHIGEEGALAERAFRESLPGDAAIEAK